MYNYSLDKDESDKIHFVGCDPQGGDFQNEFERVYNLIKTYTSEDLENLMSN